MLEFEAIIGHQTAIAAIRGLIASDRVPQAMLFHGPDAVGKACVARAFAATLLCAREIHAACGQCDSCRQVEHSTHPDLLEIGLIGRKDEDGLKAPPDSKDELRSQIIVKQVRRMTRLAGVAPRLGKRRVFLVDPADRMNTEAQNALLKTLEEPPGPSTIVLIAARPHLLLPTVRSRSFGVGFAPLDGSALAEALTARGVPSDEARVRAALAGGRPGAALELDLDALREQRGTLLELLETLAEGPHSLGALSGMVSALRPQDPQAWATAIDLLQAMLRDAARAASGGDAPPLLNVDLAQRLDRLGRRLGATRAAALVEFVDRARGLVRFNTNRTLISEALLAGVAGGPL